MEKRIMTHERAQKILEKFRPLEDQAIKEGIDCLDKYMGRFHAQHFLNAYFNKRTRESIGNDYTKWRQDNPPEEDPALMAIVDENDDLNMQMETAYVNTNKFQAA
jgi:hypothetical protein